MELRIPIRVVFYREDDAWIAHCLEFDLIGDGNTQEEALECLGTAIEIQVEQSIRYKNPRNLFSPADGKYLQMYAAGEDVAMGKCNLHVANIENVHIESPLCRKYEAPANQEAAFASSR